jgi:hypothetical protein
LGRNAWIAIPLLSYAVACLSVWADDSWRQHWDSGLYVLTARSLAAGEGYVYLDEPFFLRPPGLSWLIAAVQGDGPFDPIPLNRMMMVFAATTAAAVFFAFRPQHGRGLALAVALLAGTSPLLVQRFNWVLSELPFLTLLFLAIGCSARAGPAEEGDERWRPVYGWAGALCFAAAFYVRPAAVAALPGMLWMAWRGKADLRQRAIALAPVLLAVVLCLPWIVYGRTAAARATAPSEQLMLFDYATALLHVDIGDPESERIDAAEWGKRVTHNARGMTEAMSRSVLGTDAAAARLALVALVLFGAAKTARRRASLAEWTALGYAVILLVYFAYKPRLASPLVPFVYLYALVGLSTGVAWLALRAGARLEARTAALAFAAVLGILNAVRLSSHLDPRLGPDGETLRGARWRERVQAAHWLRENTPADAVLLVGDAPVMSVLSGRRAYSYHFVRRPGILDRHGIGYVVLSPWDGSAGGLARLAAARAVQTWTLPATGARSRAVPGEVARRSYVVHRIDSASGDPAPGAR